MSSVLSGGIRTGGDRGLFEYAAALIDVNESAGKPGTGHVRQVEDGDTANRKPHNAMEARFRRCKMNDRYSLPLGSSRSV